MQKSAELADAGTDDFVAQDVLGDLTLSDVPRAVELVAHEVILGVREGMTGPCGFAQ